MERMYAVPREGWRQRSLSVSMKRYRSRPLGVEVVVEAAEGYVLDRCHGKKAELRTDEVVWYRAFGDEILLDKLRGDPFLMEPETRSVRFNPDVA
jgi:hypothetical protein